MADPTWLYKRNRGIHLTIRDVDCRDFDVEAMIREFARLKVTFFSFFAGGYVTTYPTNLDCQRVSPYLDGRDLTGEIVETAHRYGIKAVPMIDLAMLPAHAFEKHPEWVARKSDGSPVMQADDLYASCPMGGYVREYSREMVAEIVERYDVDGMKFGGGSYGFGRTPCHCESCRAAYERCAGKPIPGAADWSDPAWLQHVRWRTDQAALTVRHLVDTVHELRPQLPVMGNAVCFGDPHWTLNSSLDMERLAEAQDAVQVEVQTRAWNNQPDARAYWQYLRWPAETTAYMTGVSEKPIWVVASYFYAWPWRRIAVPPAEQKVYLAQIAAHGGTPMVNLSGGPPAVHEDKRGFRAMEELYGFMDRHADLYSDDTSGAEIALVYDHETLVYYGRNDASSRVVEEIRGFEEAFNRHHVPFDIISTRCLEPEHLHRYRVLVLPNATALSEPAAQRLVDYNRNGGALIASFETGLIADGMHRRDDFLLGELLGVRSEGAPRAAVGEGMGPRQAYMRAEECHELLAGVTEAGLYPLSGSFCPISVRDGAATVLSRTQPFRVFPEGWSYPEGTDPGEPQAVCTDREGRGRTVYFAPQIGKMMWQAQFPDIASVICRAADWAARDERPLRVKGPPALHVSLRRQARRHIVHCVNLTGGQRLMDELVPLHDIRVGVRVSGDCAVSACRVAGTGEEAAVEREGAYVWATVPRVDDYELVVFETKDKG